jgi:predicted Zn-dependent peptidase
MKDNGFVEHTLANGLRIVIEPMPHVQSAAGGFLVRTGARDETPDLAGASHFVEHMCFKGTARRSWRQITLDFDNLGSTYNAFTSKERTFYFGWVRTEDLHRQIDLLADMMQSAFPIEEFEMEKKVILEEIAMSDDQIDRQVYDLIHEKAFAGHPLAWPVLGTTETVGAITRDQLYGYFESRYHPANLVLLVAGAVSPDKVIAMAEEVCGAWTAKSPRPDRKTPPPLPQDAFAQKTDRFQQQSLVLAFPAPGADHPDRETADVFASILGGHNSRFFWNIVQAGIAPHVAAGRVDYSDTGVMIAFGFCEPQNTGQLLTAIQREIATLTQDGVTEKEVQRVKNRARTALATEAESPYHRIMQIAGDVDNLGRPRTVGERLAAVDRVTVDRIRRYLETWPMAGTGCLATLGPGDLPPAASDGQ